MKHHIFKWMRILLQKVLGIRCDKCGGPLYVGRGPVNGWQLEDGRTVCHRCCVADLAKQIERMMKS